MNSNPSFWNIFAVKKAGQPSDWQWFKAEAAQNGIVVTGLVPTVFYKKGPLKGRPNFAKSDQSTRSIVLINYDELQSIKLEWESDTGLCSSCRGTGKRQVRFPAQDDASFVACKDCDGTGNANGGRK